MRKTLIGIAAAATLFTAGPAVSQIYLDGPGIDVQIGPDRYRDRGHYGYRNRDRDCRTVTVRERLRDGTVVVRTRERC